MHQTKRVWDSIRENFGLDNMRMAARVAIGVVLSVLIARLLQLQFAASTCIVTLLGIQSTKRDTYRTAVQRGDLPCLYHCHCLID